MKSNPNDKENEDFSTETCAKALTVASREHDQADKTE